MSVAMRKDPAEGIGIVSATVALQFAECVMALRRRPSMSPIYIAPGQSNVTFKLPSFRCQRCQVL
jgi:hypothetical protein